MPGSGRGLLEFPSGDVAVGGVGSFTGWVCNAHRVSIYIDFNQRLDAAYGTPRGDTAEVCGDTNNGFAALINWSLLTDGPHEAFLYADSVLVDRATFRVVSLGPNFLRGEEPTCKVQDFAGQDLTIQFQEASQAAVIVAAD
jgi:hypothetical protein